MTHRDETPPRKPKRPKLKGGNVKFEQTRFEPYADAVKGFEDTIWKFYGKSKKAEDKGMFGRIKFEIHYEPKETAEAYNAYQKSRKP
jgi:hypothetical protein